MKPCVIHGSPGHKYQTLRLGFLDSVFGKKYMQMLLHCRVHDSSPGTKINI